jgi:hypothetical protein
MRSIAMDRDITRGPTRHRRPLGTLLTAAAALAAINGSTALATGRVDLAPPVFSDPTSITNPLLPISEVTQAIQLGEEGGEAARVEVTRLPGTRTLTWDSTSIEAVVSQFIAYLDGRLVEIAIDHYAQSDDGAVWYLGEDVSNFEDGVVIDHEGTWLVGKDGPGGMIMPGQPAVGDVYRPENIPGLVLEEDTIRSISETVDGPTGPVQGALLVDELLMDGTIEHKLYAPGYGEFQSQASDELTTVAVAVPTDAVAGDVPEGLAAFTASARSLLAAAMTGDQADVPEAADAASSAWQTAGGAAEPPLLVGQSEDALTALADALDAGEAAAIREAAIAVVGAALDLELRYRGPTAVDLERMALWCQRVVADAAAEDGGGVSGDAAVLGVIADRLADSQDTAANETLASGVTAVTDAAASEDLEAAASAADELRGSVEAIAASLP